MLQQFVGLGAAQPALVRRREVLKQQRKDHGVERASRQAMDRAAEAAQVGAQRVRRHLQGVGRLQVQEVAVVDGLSTAITPFITIQKN